MLLGELLPPGNVLNCVLNRKKTVEYAPKPSFSASIAKVTIDRIESEELGTGRRMPGEIGVAVLGADVVGEGESVKVLVARGARNAKVRNRRTAVGLASFAGPRGKPEGGDARNRDVACAREAG